MGIKRVVEVLMHAPPELTAAERMVLVAIAENTRDSDPKRETWPDFNAATLAQRTGLTGEGTLKRALQRLGRRDLEVRIPITVGKDGRPLYALPGKQCRYRFPVLEGGTTVPPSEKEGGTTVPPGGTTVPPMAGPQSRQAGPQSPPTPPPSTPSPLQEGSEDDRQPEAIGLAAAAAFLEDLPAPWTIGPRTAGAMAPRLLEMAQRQGWRFDGDLVSKLTEKPGGINSYPPVLRLRIDDLPRRQSPPPAAKSEGPLPDWCGDCADGNPAAAKTGHVRLVYDDRGNGRPCPKCHPSQINQAA